MKREYIVIAFVNNQISVLNRITSAYLKRHINIESLNVSESYIKGVSTVVISAITTKETTEMIVNQLGNAIDILNVQFYLQEELVYKEMALYKVSARIVDNRRRFDYILNSSNGRVIEINSEFLILEKSGSRTELEKLRDKLDSMNMLSGFSRSGNVVLHRESMENLMQKVS